MPTLGQGNSCFQFRLHPLLTARGVNRVYSHMGFEIWRQYLQPQSDIDHLGDARI